MMTEEDPLRDFVATALLRKRFVRWGYSVTLGEEGFRVWASGQNLEDARRDAADALSALTCSCASWPPDGPDPACIVHGAVRALAEWNHRISKMSVIMDMAQGLLDEWNKNEKES